MMGFVGGVLIPTTGPYLPVITCGGRSALPPCNSARLAIPGMVVNRVVGEMVKSSPKVLPSGVDIQSTLSAKTVRWSI
jgi:hypothetical protein